MKNVSRLLLIAGLFVGFACPNATMGTETETEPKKGWLPSLRGLPTKKGVKEKWEKAKGLPEAGIGKGKELLGTGWEKTKTLREWVPGLEKKKEPTTITETEPADVPEAKKLEENEFFGTLPEPKLLTDITIDTTNPGKSTVRLSLWKPKTGLARVKAYGARFEKVGEITVSIDELKKIGNDEKGNITGYLNLYPEARSYVRTAWEAVKATPTGVKQVGKKALEYLPYVKFKEEEIEEIKPEKKEQKSIIVYINQTIQNLKPFGEVLIDYNTLAAKKEAQIEYIDSDVAYIPKLRLGQAFVPQFLRNIKLKLLDIEEPLFVDYKDYFENKAEGSILYLPVLAHREAKTLVILDSSVVKRMQELAPAMKRIGIINKALGLGAWGGAAYGLYALVPWATIGAAQNSYLAAVPGYTGVYTTVAEGATGAMAAISPKLESLKQYVPDLPSHWKTIKSKAGAIKDYIGSWLPEKRPEFVEKIVKRAPGIPGPVKWVYGKVISMPVDVYNLILRTPELKEYLSDIKSHLPAIGEYISLPALRDIPSTTASLLISQPVLLGSASALDAWWKEGKFKDIVSAAITGGGGAVLSSKLQRLVPEMLTTIPKIGPIAPEIKQTIAATVSAATVDLFGKSVQQIRAKTWPSKQEMKKALSDALNRSLKIGMFSGLIGVYEWRRRLGTEHEQEYQKWLDEQYRLERVEAKQIEAEQREAAKQRIEELTSIGS